ncbi:hypothetical protein SM124_01870 [Bacillus sp. 31A1R]|uniref:Uncharacterized protein n=1 Tax=Robertmurraya mangrovi TaxID=3098077 RepID=A0ABU5ITL7_9BACI|nr:hypothetical protein [Bacillus sp. 31A1R]MDZ5470486.1 hypothetical protein [Bacillus sp. 31A1R]
MNRSDRHIEKKTPSFFKGILIFTTLLCIGVISIYIYSIKTIQIEAPKKELGRKVVIDLPSGKQVYTYENLIVEENGKMYYEGERNKIDLTGGTVQYKNWK